MPNEAFGKFAKAAGAAAAVALALFSANAAMLASERRGEAGFLTGLHAADGLVLLTAEQHAIAADPNHKIDPRSRDAIRSTLRFQPLNPQVLALLGVSAAGPDGTSPATDRLMKLADRISRREPLSQIWMIETASAADDVPGAVRHYHTVLSTNPGLYGTLIPILATAIDYPEVQSSLRPYLRGEPVWKRSFLDYAATNAKLDSYLGLIGGDFGIVSGPALVPANSEFVARLGSAGRGDEAKKFAAKSLPEFNADAFGAAGFSKASLDPRMGKLAWVAGSGSSVDSVSISGEVAVSIEPDAEADVLSRSFMVKPSAAYLASVAVDADEPAKLSSFKLIITCADGTSTGNWEHVIPVGSAKETAEIRFPGLDRCNLLNIKFRVIADARQTPLVVKIADFAVVPL